MDSDEGIDGSLIVGANTTVTIKTHEGTFPTLPDLGKALSVLLFDLPVPHMSIPRAPGDDDDDDKPPKFIQEATVGLRLFLGLNKKFTCP
jgi:hypothetical protein